MNRGDHQERIFGDDQDRLLFLTTLAEACLKTGWQIHAFCLMSNHFHLVVETPSANLVEGMKWFLGVYTRRFNRRQHFFGHLFSGRYKALIVDGSGNGYLKTVGDYVHLNPARAGLLRPEQSLLEYRWSSYPLYVADHTPRPDWLRVDRLLGEWRISWDVPGAGAQFAAVMEARRQGELEREFKAVERGWCLGAQEFRAEMLKYVQEQRGKWHYGQELWESAQAKAEHLITETLKDHGVSEQTLASWMKGHPVKVELAARLRAETTVTLEWIARRLGMGTRGHLAQLLQERTRPERPSLDQSMLGL
jgi:REP element-mobilizing transposase RayT